MPVSFHNLFDSPPQTDDSVKDIPISQLRNNCVLVALKKVSEKPDREILSVALEHGYIKNRGILGDAIPYMVRDLDLNLSDRRSQLQELRRSKLTTRVAFERKLPTLRKVKKSFPKGVFLILVPGHCLTMIDGQIIDPNCPSETQGRKVIHLWQVTKG